MFKYEWFLSISKRRGKSHKLSSSFFEQSYDWEIRLCLKYFVKNLYFFFIKIINLDSTLISEKCGFKKSICRNYLSIPLDSHTVLLILLFFLNIDKFLRLCEDQTFLFFCVNFLNLNGAFYIFGIFLPFNFRFSSKEKSDSILRKMVILQ